MTLAQSSKRLIEDKIEAFNVGNLLRVYDEKIRTPGDGLIIFQGMQDHSAESIKSLEAYRIVWIEEAQSLSQRSLALLRPTIRAEGSQIWASWNPRRKTDAIDEFLRQRRSMRPRRLPLALGAALARRIVAASTAGGGRCLERYGPAARQLGL